MLFLDSFGEVTKNVYSTDMPVDIRLYDDITDTYFNMVLTSDFDKDVLGVEHRDFFFTLRRYNNIDRQLRSCLVVEDYTNEIFSTDNHAIISHFDGVEMLYPEHNCGTIWHLVENIIINHNILNRIMSNKVYIDVYDRNDFMFKCIILRVLDMKKFKELAGKIKMLGVV